MPDYKALVGDSSDNLPGIPGIGPKTAAGLLQAWGSAEAVFSEAAMPAHAAGVQRKLQGQEQAAAMYKDLTILRCAATRCNESAVSSKCCPVSKPSWSSSRANARKESLSGAFNPLQDISVDACFCTHICLCLFCVCCVGGIINNAEGLVLAVLAEMRLRLSLIVLLLH